MAKNESFESLLKIARERGVPIVVVRTSDQFATTAVIQQVCAGFAVVQWDAARGLTPTATVDGQPDPKAADALKKLGVTPDQTVQFVDAMSAVQKMPRAGVVVAHNAHRQVQSSEPYAVAHSVQAIMNLRDQFKRDFRMLILMGPIFTVPSEMEHDVVVLDHALPGEAVLATLVKELHVSAKLDPPTEAVLTKAVEATRGLSEFAAEQQVAMSLMEKTATSSGGLDMDALWERKRVAIEATDGLSVYRGKETLDDLKGLTSIKARLRQHKQSRTPLGVVVWIDEGSDVFANVEHDSSGVKTDQQKVLLVEMEQNNWRGMIFVGVPGSGKSAVARAFGNEAGVPEIAVDFGAMESRYVGDSEAKLRHAVQVIKNIGCGNAFFVLTCNSLKGIRPQFMRRFRRGVFFFDLPTVEERASIWALYRSKYSIPATELQPVDDGWTGAEIRECCESAWDTKTTLIEAARFIIPVSQSRAPEIEAMRLEANGRFLSASHPGAYTYAAEPMAKSVRAIALPGGLIPALDQMKES